MNLSVLAGRLSAEAEYFLHLDHLSLSATDLADAHDAPLTITQPLQLDDNFDCGSNLGSNTLQGHGKTGHADHLLQTRKSITRRIGVYGGHRAFVTGIHCLQHVECFLAAHLSDDDAV